LIIVTPMQGLRLPPARTGKRKKPMIAPEEFIRLIVEMSEPYATMVITDLFSGLRASELIGLKWNDVRPDSLMVDEGYCRGDWSEPKSQTSNPAVDVDPRVIERILTLKDKTVTIPWGGKGASKTIKLVRSSNPEDLVFQSLVKGGPMSDGNILRRHIKPAARAQLRHADPKLAMLVYAQVVRDSQRKSVSKMSGMFSEHGFNWDINVTCPSRQAA
jgi:integrase